MLFLTTRTSWGLILIFFCIYCQVNAQGSLTPKPRQEPYIKGLNSFFGYYEYLPIGYDTDSTKQFPLIIYLSGLESVGDGINDLDTLLNNGVAKMIKDGRHFPALVMTPQSIGGFWNPDRVNDYLDFILTNYRVDRSRIYITGISAGGSGAFSYAAIFPEKITAVVPISGRGNNLDMCGMTDVPIWAFHNADDTVFSHVSSIIPIDNLNNCDPAPIPPGRITIYPSGGHDAWTKTYDGSGMGTEDTLYDAFDMDVFDWLLQFAKDTILIDAGTDQLIFYPQKDLRINSYAASHDGLHTYTWTQLKGPEINLSNQISSTLEIHDIPVGEYTIVLTVTDNFGKTAFDTVEVTIRPPNAPPVVDAGEDQTVFLPVDSIIFNGTATDPENDAISVVWMQETGPADASLQYDDTQVVIRNLEEGQYVFKLIVTDEYDSVGVDVVQLTVINPIPDVGVVEIQKSDTSGVPFSSEENITIIIKNFGNIPQKNFDVGYLLGEGEAVLETIAEEIAPDSSFTYTFGALADMSLLQNYTLRAFTSLAEDIAPDNDSTQVNLNWLPTISTFPFEESFEQTTEARWLTFGENSSWEQGQPMNIIIDTAADGTHAWVTGLQEDYHDNEFSFLLSPIFDFSTLTTDPAITYDVWQVIEPEDSAKLCFTTDGGAHWKSYDLINDNFLASDSARWLTVTHHLEGLAGQKSVLFRIEFKADGTKHNEGIAFDNVFICNSLPGLLPIPDTLVTAGETVSIPFEVDSADPPDITFYAVSGNQLLIPDENIIIEGHNLTIELLEEAEGEADITVYAQAQCVSEISFKITVEKITGTSKVEADTNAKVYPNPSPGYYQIEMKYPVKTVNLYNQEGKLMKDFILIHYIKKDFFININHYPRGLYFLKIETSQGISIHKLIKD